jgi:membrane protease YdiL (CAAX protease family)
MRLLKTAIVFVLLWLVLDRTAYLLGSVRGEAGLTVCLAVLAAAIAAEMVMAGHSPAIAAAALGLRAPSWRGLGAALALSALLLGYFPIFALAAGTTVSLRTDAAVLALGILAQGGIAEETVFRGFLFRRLREWRSFWRATALAAAPFAGVHALLFLSLDFTIALASILLALSLSFPLAWLFEAGGGSVLPPAIVHAVVQGAIKLVEVEDGFSTLAVGWIALSAVAPWALFLLRPSSPERPA